MTPSNSQLFEPDGRAVPFADAGEGPGVVLVPARGRGIDSLAIMELVLVDLGFRVLRVGSRSASVPAATLHDLAQDVVDVMAHVGLGHAWVGGQAFGGVVARTVSLDHTAQVGGVLLLGVQAPGASPEESGADADLAAMLDATLAATPEAEWAPLSTGLPVLAIEGTDDAVTPTANGDALKELAPMFVSLSRIDGAGHDFLRTHPAETGEFVEDFLGWD